jgi:hypothetical protein
MAGARIKYNTADIEADDSMWEVCHLFDASVSCLSRYRMARLLMKKVMNQITRSFSPVFVMTNYIISMATLLSWKVLSHS